MSRKNSGRRRKLLENLDIKELKTYLVSIKRHSIPNPKNPIPIERGLGDPALLKIHIDGRPKDKPIFDRDDIIVNNDEDSEVTQTSSSNTKGETTKSTFSSNESKKNNRPYIEEYPNLSVPLRKEVTVKYFKEHDSDKYRHSPRRKRSRSPSYEKTNPQNTRNKSLNYKLKHFSPEYKNNSSKEHTASPQRDRHEYQTRYKEYHKPIYRKSRSLTPQPSTSRTQRSVSKSPGPSKRRNYSPQKYRSRSPSRSREIKYAKEGNRSCSPPHKSRSRRNSRSWSRNRTKSRSKSPPRRPGEYIPAKRAKSPYLRPGEYIPKRRSRSPKLRPGEYIPKRRSRSPKLRPGEYIPRKKSRTPDLRSSEHAHKKRSRSRSPHEKSKRRSRSYSPKLKPGEYRPRKKSRSPPLRAGEYRPSKHKERGKSFEHPPSSYEYPFYNEIDYGSVLRPPFLPRFPHRPILRHGQILVPHLQFIPYPACPPVRPPFVRPPKVYNHRVIPKFNATQETTSIITKAGDSNVVAKQEKHPEADSPSDPEENKNS